MILKSLGALSLGIIGERNNKQLPEKSPADSAYNGDS